MRFAILLGLLAPSIPFAVDGFLVSSTSKPNTHTSRSSQRKTKWLFASRYGPPIDDFRWSNETNGDEEEEEHGHQKKLIKRQESDFRDLLVKVRTAAKPEHIPSILSKHTELLLEMEGGAVVKVVRKILEEAKLEGGEEEVERVAEAIDMIISFAEDFVQESKIIDDQNRQLLGKIIRTMVESEGSEREREEKLDVLMANEKEHFTRGFLHFLSGEIERIASAPKVSKESARLQEIIMVIKTRILEELGKDLGEGALVLGKLVSYDDKQERLAVLGTGLQVRGISFAQDLASLTEEALHGFKSVSNGADPTLVSRVKEIDAQVKKYIEENSSFQ